MISGVQSAAKSAQHMLCHRNCCYQEAHSSGQGTAICEATKWPTSPKQLSHQETSSESAGLELVWNSTFPHSLLQALSLTREILMPPPPPHTTDLRLRVNLLLYLNTSLGMQRRELLPSGYSQGLTLQAAHSGQHRGHLLNVAASCFSDTSLS